MTREIKKVLVIQAGSIGEFVLSLAAMKQIRKAHPHANITLLTAPQFEALARAMTTAIEAGGERRRAMGQIAAARARRLYSVNAMCEATLEVYARVLEARA